MPTVSQRWNGDAITLGDPNNGSVETEYVIHFAATEWDAWVALNLATTTPQAGIQVNADSLVRGDVRITERLGETTWAGTVSWKSRAQSQGELIDQSTPPGGVGDGMTWNFEIGGGTQNIRQALATTRYTDGVNFEDDDRVIGDHNPDQEPAGGEIGLREMRWSETWKFSGNAIAFDFLNSLYLLKDTTNDASFRGFDTGEVLFDGTSGGKQTENEIRLTYKFRASPNVGSLLGRPDLVLSPNVVITKKHGWDYLDVRYKSKAESGAVRREVKEAKVHTVYPSTDFSALLIGT